MTNQQRAKRWIALGQKWEGAKDHVCECGCNTNCGPEVNLYSGICHSDNNMPPSEYNRFILLFRPEDNPLYYWPKTEDGAKDRAIACYLMAETVGDPT